MVAIGGLSAKDFKDVLQAGADGIAVISAISHAEDPTKRPGYWWMGCKQCLSKLL